MTLWHWLVPDRPLDGWTPQRALAAEREMLKREGIVVEPHFLWSQPAQAHEKAAAANRERASRGDLIGQLPHHERISHA